MVRVRSESGDQSSQHLSDQELGSLYPGIMGPGEGAGGMSLPPSTSLPAGSSEPSCPALPSGWRPLQNTVICMSSMFLEELQVS